MDEFGTAIRLGERGVDGESLENDEVECLVANMIYKVRISCCLNAVCVPSRSPHYIYLMHTQPSRTHCMFHLGNTSYAST